MKQKLTIYALLVALLVLTTVGIAIGNSPSNALTDMQTIALD